MTLHLSARLAWHMDGWNGRICSNPATNTYCVGQFSYPGDMISMYRDLDWEKSTCGRACATLDRLPPCTSSINAFGPDSMEAWSAPPDFFKSGDAARWSLPASTVAVWPYEEMYKDEVRPNGTYDNDLRRQAARRFFEQIEENRSLIFYYANYSNPFSEEDQRRYVVVGLSRVKSVGEELLYPNCDPETRRKFADGLVWQRNITSHYPDQGFRLPYHAYLDRPDVIERFLVTPPNPRNFKYGSRLFGDDEALELVERLAEAIGAVREFGDRSEDWPIRLDWLNALISELWRSRGLYPGLPAVLRYLGFHAAIPWVKAQVIAGAEKEAIESVFAFLDRQRTPTGFVLSADQARRVVRQWRLKSEDERRLLRDVLPRFDLPTDQIARILSQNRESWGIASSLEEIADNPYILSEGFVGDGPDDTITFNKIDRGMFPSPDLGGSLLTEPDDPERLRALCVERLKREPRHTFIEATQVVHDVNEKLSYFPEWKRHEFAEQYLEVDREVLEQTLVIRQRGDRRYLYLRPVYGAERAIEKQIRSLANGPDISFRAPVTEAHWRDFLYSSDSSLAEKAPDEYDRAITEQARVCQQIFVRPISVLSGPAGTGKTTIIKALIQAAEKAHGAAATFRLLAPTGKAAERIRSATGKPAETMHSFLARRGWLNENFTFKAAGGKREDQINTYIIDEASMVDLDLMAAFFRAVHWASVQRLILVGDPNQLPPIGRGRVFADIIDWLHAHKPESIGVLETNIRQMENRVTGRGTGILDVAALYVRRDQDDDIEAEQLLGRIQEGGEIDKDLRVIYWQNPEDLEEKLVQTIITDLEAEVGEAFDEGEPDRLWSMAFRAKERDFDPHWLQIITPYRGEQFGTEHLNQVLQRRLNRRQVERIGQLGGITLFDKIIQVINRPSSNPVWAYDTVTRARKRVEIYNGEIGFAQPDLRDWKGNKWLQPWFSLRRFHAVFSRNPSHRIEVDGNSFVEENLELGYAISVHKAQGSEFKRVYFVLPKHKRALLSRELLYTGITRGTQHCTIFAEEDVLPFVSMRRPENSHLVGVNSSLFEFNPVPDAILRMREWYEEGKIHRTLAAIMVRSKSEVIIANMLFERDIPFKYEVPLFAPDGTFYLPDFTITWRGEQWYWEHLGRLDDEGYRNHWETKKAWYDRHFPGHLVTTMESGDLSRDADELISMNFP